MYVCVKSFHAREYSLYLFIGVQSGKFSCAAVLGRNQTLFRWAHYYVRNAVTQYFRYGWDLYVLCKLMNT